MRYFLNDLNELTTEKMRSIIFDWQVNELHRLQKYKDYYDGEQEILNKIVEDLSKPNNQLVANYCFDITENYNGYLVGIPVSYSAEDDIDDMLDILNYNDVHSEDVEYLRNALIYGVAFEICYLDAEAKQRFKVLDSREVIPIFTNDLDAELLCCLRLYSANDIDDVSAAYVDVYTDKEIIKYKTNSTYQNFEFIERTKHYYGMPPITVFALNADWKSCFDRIISLQDAYNTLLSGGVDGYEEFIDALLALKGLQGTTDEDIADMKKNRVILLPEDSDAFWITKDSSTQPVYELLDRINDQIQKIAKCPDFNDESFMAQSGVAIQYKLVGMENVAASIEANMRKALLKRLELLSQIQRLTTDNTNWVDIDITFTRNLPENLQDLATSINSFRGLVSDKTLLSQIPFVKDVDREVEQLEEQKQSEVSTMYEFNYEDEEE